MALAAASPLWPFFRILRPGFVAAFPRVGLAFAGLIAASVSILGAITLWIPGLLPWLAAAAIAWNARQWWRGRADYGASRKLPPGSLTILPPGPWIDPRHYMGLSRIHGPIFKASHFFHPMVCIHDLDSGLRLLKEHDDVRMLSPKVAADRFLPCGFLRGMAPQDHKTWRKLIQSLITPRVIAAWEPSIRADVTAALRELANSPDGVYPKPAWDRMIRRTFSRLFFGIAPDTPEFERIEEAFGVIAKVSDRRISVPWLPSERHTARVLEETCDLLRRQTAPDCFLAELRRNEEFAGASQALRLLLFMQYLGGSDLSGLLQWAVKIACDFPAEIAKIRAAIDRGDSPEAINRMCRAFTLELLRRHQVEHLYRRVLEDFEWEGYRIPKGWLLRISLSDAHRNPEIFANAAGFQPDRFLENPPARNQFLPFGAFRRACLGDGVTHTLMTQFLMIFASEWECRQTGESHEDYRLWHWTPGSDFRVVIRPRSAS